jgi:isoleucyl-tRNA synthetase
MSSFYLDIIKDRLYTAPRDSAIRRSAQTAMYHILEAMVRWIAPIISFTAEEIWAEVPGGREESVFMSTWYQGLHRFTDEQDRQKWQRIISMRDEVSKSIESLRKAGEIGSSLASEVNVFASGQLKQDLAWLGDELRFVLITAEAGIADMSDAPPDALRLALEDGGELAITVQASKDTKCVRCWHQRPEVGQSSSHPELCSRCISNVEGPGESRRVA